MPAPGEFPEPEVKAEAKPELLEVALNFRAMNTHIEVLIYTDEPEKAAAFCEQVEDLFNYNEAVLSRFKPESELSELNRTGFKENASELLFQNVTAASQMHEFTGGIFDPTILDALEAAGYNRSFEKISSGQPQLFMAPQPGNFGNWKPANAAWISLDSASRSIKLAPGVRIDLGGIAKGTTVDQAAGLLREAGFNRFMVGAGGDMFVEGCPPQDSQGWNIVVDNPLDKESAPVASLQVTNQAVATSSTTRRAWYLGQERQHHLIDPRTNHPSTSQFASVTVVAPSVKMADVMAKVALILGPAELRQSHLREKSNLGPVVFVTMEGEVIKF